MHAPLAHRHWVAGAVVGPVSLSTATAVIAIVALALLALVVLYATGGSPSALNHLSYLSIGLAAYKFGWRGSVPAALLVGYLVGPFGATIGMPNDGLNAWLTRGIAFVTIGAVGGVLFDRMRAALALADEEARQLSERKREAIAIFARCAEAKDETTGHHVVRIAETARELARVAGLDAAAVDEISWSSMLHDVGKLHIPDHILTKPGRLTPEEWVIIQLHTVLGERILGTGHGFAVARRIARSHHENFDGTGYPDGLSHAEIPLEARIVRICDAFDAMTNKRPYSPATSVQHALEEIERFAGRQFDPELARAFIELVPRLDIHPLGDPASIAVAKGTLAAEGP